jgi:hypothetical protein
MSTPIIEPYAVFMLYGRKIFIFLEEVGMLHSVHPNSLTKGEQKNPELTRIGPYGRIPADTSSNTPPATQKVAGSYGYGEGDAKAARSCVANSLRALMAQRNSDCAWRSLLHPRLVDCAGYLLNRFRQSARPVAQRTMPDARRGAAGLRRPGSADQFSARSAAVRASLALLP